MMITATVPKPSWYKERGKNLIEEYRGGRECGGSRNSVIRRLAESYGMSEEDIKQIMLDAGLKPYELPERMREGFYDKPRAFAEVEPPPALRRGTPTGSAEPPPPREAKDSAAAGKAANGRPYESAAAGVLPGMKGTRCRINGAPCNGCKPICDSVIVEDGEGPHFADGRAKPTGEGSGLIDRENVLEKLREKCQGCDNYNRVRCRWCETGRAIKIVQEAEDV